jgi:hypothetical protein
MVRATELYQRAYLEGYEGGTPKAPTHPRRRLWMHGDRGVAWVRSRPRDGSCLADGSLRHMYPGAKLGWNELLPLKPDADPLETVPVRWVLIELCTATDAVLDGGGR